MLNRCQQFGILIVACVLGLFATDAQAGYVSSGSVSNLASISVNPKALTTGTSSSSIPLDQNQDRNPDLHRFEISQMALHLGPSGSGGMSSVSGSSGGHVSFALIVIPETMTPSLITPLVIGDEPISLRIATSGIFRPPCQ